MVLLASRVLFVVSGGVWVLIGVLAPLLMDTGTGRQMVFMSPGADAELYGRAPSEVLAPGTDIGLFRVSAFRALAGMLVVGGVMVIGVAVWWLGDRTAAPLVLLSIVSAAVLPYWWFVTAPYRSAGIRLTLGDLPPFMWIPGTLMFLATVLGWLAYARTSA